MEALLTIASVILKDYFRGCCDAFIGLSIIRDLDKEDEFVTVNAAAEATPRSKTVLQSRREKEKGTITRPAEKIIRQRPRAWKRLLQCIGVNTGFVILCYLVNIIFRFFMDLFLTDGYDWFTTGITYFLLAPLFFVLRIILTLWFSDIAGSCYRSRRLPEPRYVDFRVFAADLVTSVVLGLIFLLQSYLASMIPITPVSILIQYVHNGLLYSMYCFEYFWSSRSVPLHERIARLQKYWPYYLGFGTPLALATALSSDFFISACMFGATFPGFMMSSYKSTYAEEMRAEERQQKVYIVPTIKFFGVSQVVTDKLSAVLSDYCLNRVQSQTKVKS